MASNLIWELICQSLFSQILCNIIYPLYYLLDYIYCF